MDRKVLVPFFLCSTMFVTFSCITNDEVYDPYKQLQKDVVAIDAYLTSNSIDAEKDLTGVRMVITQLGTGLPATLTSKVEVGYVGKFFPNGTTFDEGTTTNVLSGYIDGWKIAMTTLPAGSKATLYIPSVYGYGATSQGTIPANSILVFDVDFKKVIPTSAEAQQFNSDTTAINTYLETKSITAIKDTTGIRYVITQQGSGPNPSWYDKLKLKYSIKLLTDDTKVVFSSAGEPSSVFASRNVDYNFLQGLMIGLQKISPGGKATLYIPSGLAYRTIGATNNGTVVVPPNSNLIVDVELLEIVP